MKLLVRIAAVIVGFSCAVSPDTLLRHTTKSILNTSTNLDVDTGNPLLSAISKVDVFALPTVSRCIVIIVCQFMLVSMALAIVRTCHEFTGTSKGKLAESLEAAAQTATYGPMLCVVFVACRMHVEFSSDGKDDPQMWVQDSMCALTVAVTASTLLALLVPLMASRYLPAKPRHHFEISKLEEHSRVGFCIINFAQCLILAGICGGLAIVIVGVNVYSPPGPTDLNKVLPLAPAVKCTMILAVLFFLVQILVGTCRVYTEFLNVQSPRIVGAMIGASSAVESAPMLAALFLAARMRALQHDGQPQAWAQDSMLAATVGMCAAALFAILAPIALGGNIDRSAHSNEREKVTASRLGIGYLLVAARLLCTFALCAGALGVIYSIFVFEAPDGPEATYAVSPTVQCVVNLTCQFFFVYFMMTLILTVSEVHRVPLETNSLFYAIKSSKATLQFAPMLSILFVAARMYALLITSKKGAPQAWVQDGMFIATWSLLLSFLVCLLRGLFVDEMRLDEAGHKNIKLENKHAAIAMTAIRYISLLSLYGGISMVVVGLFAMTPETANGRGAVPMV